MTALYVYCVIKAARKPSLGKVPRGLPDASPVDLVPVSSSLWLAAADVPLDRYTGAALEASLADLDWVSRVALAHEEVVEHFSRRAAVTVVPMKLFTLFSARERAAAEFRRRRASIDRVIRRISGAEEWGVRVTRSPAAAGAAIGVDRRTTSGAAFLERKKQAREGARHARLAAAEAAGHAYDALAKIARASRRREVAAAAGMAPPLLDAAFLVPSTKRGTFTRTASREARVCATAGAQLTVSGPWPAYNFVQGNEPGR